MDSRYGLPRAKKKKKSLLQGPLRLQETMKAHSPRAEVASSSHSNYVTRNRHSGSRMCVSFLAMVVLAGLGIDNRQVPVAEIP